MLNKDIFLVSNGVGHNSKVKFSKVSSACGSHDTENANTLCTNDIK